MTPGGVAALVAGHPAVSLTAPVSHCRVDAAGVPAEWVEATVATHDQPTLVYFARRRGDGVDTLERIRQPAANLARATGARLLTVECCSVDAGVAAYTWLLGEGCALDKTSFIYDEADLGLLKAILRAVEAHGLPIPAGATGVHGRRPPPRQLDVGDLVTELSRSVCEDETPRVEGSLANARQYDSRA